MSRLNQEAKEVFVGEKVEDTLKKVVVANQGRRFVAALMDFVITAFIAFVLYLTAGIKIAEACGYKQAQLDTIQYQYFSGVTTLVENNGSANFVVFESDRYSRYQVRVEAFYFEFLSSNTLKEDSPLPTGNTAQPWEPAPNWNDDIVLEDGSKVKPKDYYTTYWYNTNVLKLPNKDGTANTSGDEVCLFEYEVVDGNISYDTLGKPKDGVTDEELLSFYQKAFYDVQTCLAGQSFYREASKVIVASEYINAGCCILLSIGIFYFLFPLLSKNGETLSKHTLHIQLCNKYGFAITKKQTVLRGICLTFEIILGIASLGLLVFASFLCALFTKNHQSLHDLVSATLVIDTRKSTIYETVDQERGAVEAYKRRIALHSHQPEDEKK